MAIVLTCHLIETIWSRRDTGTRAPFMVIDHNGQQHQTEVMKAGAVTVWNTKATFPYAPSSDLVVMAFDAAGRQPGAFIAQAVVDVAAMLQQGSLNASAALVNRRGQNVGVVVFDVGLVTSSKALAAGLDIPSLTLSTHPCPDSPTAQLTRSASPTLAAAVNGRNSPFAQLSVQRNLAQGGSEMQPGTPGTAQSISQKLVGSISQALVGALLGLETRDRDHTQQQAGSFGLRSSSISPRRMGVVSRSLDCSPTRQAAQQQQQQQQQQQRSSTEVKRAPGQKAAAAAAGSSSVSAANGPLLSRRSLLQQTHADSVAQPPSPPPALARTSTTASGAASAPPMGTLSSDRASFSAWRHSGTAGPLTAARPGAVSSSNSPSTNAQDSPNASPTHSATRANSRRPSQLSIPQAAPLGDTSNGNVTSPNPGSGRNLSPLTEARSRLRLQRPQPLPPLSQLFPPTQREGLIPVGRAPMSPGGYSQATTAGYSYMTSQFSNGMSQGPEASADYDALLREFDAADAAGKEAILFRELMVQQQERQAGTSHLLSMLSQQNQREVLEHRQLMDALEGMASASPVTSPARAAADAFRSCFSSSTQITSGSSSNGGGSSDGSRGDTPFKHYPNLPEFATAAGAGNATAAATAAAAAVASPQRKGKQTRGMVVSPAAAPAVGSPSRPAAGGQLQQLSSAENDASPLYSARRGHKLLGDRVGQQGSVQSSPTAAAAAAAESAEHAAAVARQLNWQLLERMTQQEMAAAAAAAPVESYPISHANTEISDAVSDADAAPDASETAATPKSMRQPPVPPAYRCKKAPGQLGAYCTTSSSSDQAAAKKSSSSGGSSSSKSRWVAPARDVVPYPKPQPAFPVVAVTVEPTAPLMPVAEEYPRA